MVPGGRRVLLLLLDSNKASFTNMANGVRRRSRGTSVVRVTAGRDRREITRLLDSLPRPATAVFAARGRAPYGVPPRSRLYEAYRRLHQGAVRSRLDGSYRLAIYQRARARLDRGAMLREQMPPAVRRCEARRRRREVMHAKGVAGRSGSAYKRQMRGARHNQFSQVRC